MTTEIIEKSFDVSTPAELVVKNIRGKTTVRPGTADVIQVKATMYMDDGDPDLTELSITKDADGRVKVFVHLPETFFGIRHRRPLRIDFDIQAPAQTNITAKVVSGSLDISGFDGRMDLNTVSGSMLVKDLSGDLDLDTVSGRIEGRQLSGPAHISVVSGKIDVQECDFPTLSAKTVSGKAKVQTRLGEGPYRITTVSGSSWLVVPQDSNCQVEACAVSGRFYTDLDVTRSKSTKRSWSVQLGDGGIPIRMKAVSGKMHLLSSFEAHGQVPGTIEMSSTKRNEILNNLSEGNISVEEAIQSFES